MRKANKAIILKNQPGNCTTSERIMETIERIQIFTAKFACCGMVHNVLNNFMSNIVPMYTMRAKFTCR